MGLSVGTLAKMGIGTTSTVDQPLEFLTESVRKSMRVLDTNGIRGTVHKPTERTRADAYTVSGSISMNPGPDELDDILPYVTGSAKSGNAFPLAQTIGEFYLSIDRVAKVFTYAGCKIARCRFASGEGRLLDVTLDIEGKTETVGNAGTFPSLTQELEQPFCFYDAALTIGGNTESVIDWEVTIENVLRARTLNSATRTDIVMVDRNISVRLTMPYTSDETALYDLGNTGAAVVLTLTNGAYSLTLDMASVKFDTESPTVAGRDEIPLTLMGMARQSSTTLPIVVSLDSTP